MKVLGILLLSILLTSCATHNTAESWQKEETETTPVNIGLHDIWVLESVSGKGLKMKHETPRLEIYVTEKRVSGFDGCNEIYGDIVSLDSTSLKFGDIASTLTYCQEMEVPQVFNNAISLTRSYSIAKMRLHLFDEDGNELMVLRKVD